MSEVAVELAEARAWNACHPKERVSGFACRYPGRYREAASALRFVRREAAHPLLGDYPSNPTERGIT